MIRFGRGRARTAVVIIGALGLIGAYQGVSTGAAEPDAVEEALKSSRAQVEAINNINDVPTVVQSLIPGTLEARDAAITRFQAAGASAAPGSKPEYAVVWAGKNNIGDMSGNDWMRFVGQGAISPTGLLNVGTKQWLAGLDAMVVVDVRKSNVDGTANPDYGKVVNFVQVPPPFGVEGEPHHMQYEWQPGQPIIAGHLFTDLTSIWDVNDIPNITLKNIVRGEENPLGAFPDAYDFVGDRAIGTYMTAGEPNYGGSPGSVVVFKPDSAKGMIQEAEVPASQVGAVLRGNPNGVPEPCTLEEARPMGTCGNPHGIQARPDLGRMVTNDYADARELGSDPLKTAHQGAFRPTSRIWDISDPSQPKLVSVAHMPKSFKNTPNPAHDNIGIMEGAKTYGASKGFFSGSMCGGGIFFLPDVTNVQPDSSSQWKQVWDDGMTEIQVPDHTNVGSGNQGSEPGACAGGAWHQVSPDNRFMFRAVGGRNPGSTNTYDNGSPKMIYVINIEKLIASAADGTVDCSIDSGRELGQGHGDEADCPTLAGVITVDDNTTGGPHWGALDNFNFTPAGSPTRMMFCDYFVARTGYDGNHRCYMLNVDPTSGALSYDTAFRDEWNGSLGIDFNRGDWPGHDNAGFYKPHSMVFVTPEAVAGESGHSDSKGPGAVTPPGPFVYRPTMDSYKVTDEGGGIIRVDAESRLVRKPLASALCDEVDKRVAEAGYDGFKILMNMSAMAKGTPAAGLYVLGSMKKYPLQATAMYGANGFMRGMATTVMGIARFSNFEIFEEEALARDWLERQGAGPTTLAPDCAPTARLRRLAVPAGLLASGALVFRALRSRRGRSG